MRQLTIEPMFRDALPKLTEKEFHQLEENILEAGEVREPLIVWHNTIIDGHHRYEIVQKHPEIPFKVKQMEFADQWDAIDWMCRNQLGRRNLTPEHKEYVLGKRYEAQRNTHGGDRRSDDFSNYQTGNLKTGRTKAPSTAERIAKEEGVGFGTVIRAGEFSSAVDKAEKEVPGFRDAVVSGKLNASRSSIRAMNYLEPEDRKEAAEAMMRGEAVTVRKPNKVEQEEREPYNAEDFRLELSQFAPNLDSTIQMTLNMHGEMLEKEVCRMDFNDMLDAILAVVEKYKEVIKE